MKNEHPFVGFIFSGFTRFDVCFHIFCVECLIVFDFFMNLCFFNEFIQDSVGNPLVSYSVSNFLQNITFVGN